MGPGLSTIEGTTLSKWNPSQFAELGDGLPLGRFEPRARYYDAMDFIIYLSEDRPYRADRIDPFLTLLWHPREHRAIGVKLKGIRFVFQRLQALMASMGVNLSDGQFVPVVSLLELMMTANLGSVMTAEIEWIRLNEDYQTARRVVGAARLDTREIIARAA